MSKFKVGDEVRVVNKPYCHDIEGSIKTSKSLNINIGDVSVINSIDRDNDCFLNVEIEGGLKCVVNESCLELVEEANDDIIYGRNLGVCDINSLSDVSSILFTTNSDVSSGNGGTNPFTYFDQSESLKKIKMYMEAQYEPELKTKKTIMKTITDNMKRMLSPKHQTLYKVGYLNGDLDHTEKGKEALLDILFVEHEDKLVAKAEEIIKKEKEEKK